MEQPSIPYDTVLLPHEEQETRLNRIRTQMAAHKIPAILIAYNADIYYLTGRVFCGYIYIPADGCPTYFVRRPIGLHGNGTAYIHKPEMMVQHKELDIPPTIGIEMDLLPYAHVERLEKVFEGTKFVNASKIIREARSRKTDYEIQKIIASGIKQMSVYALIPELYREGMTDLELQIEIEHLSRLEECLGQFRISGSSMELFMGSVLSGDNADNPTPYDFAMGGAGLDPSIPVGANGSVIKPGNTVMIDVNGNYTGYMTDMTRTYYIGDISDEAIKAHQCSIDICRELERIGTPGTPAKDLYEAAEAIVREQNFEDYFMGHRQHAPFIGHGTGIEINELPVIAPRSRDILASGNIIALEPKFVIPGTGAVGIENTYLVSEHGLKSLTPALEELIPLV